MKVITRNQINGRAGEYYCITLYKRLGPPSMALLMPGDMDCMVLMASSWASDGWWLLLGGARE